MAKGAKTAKLIAAGTAAACLVAFVAGANTIVPTTRTGGLAAQGAPMRPELKVADRYVDRQRRMLKVNFERTGFGPQSPRDIDAVAGTNPVHFAAAPDASEMNLCNIHFHESAEHRGGEFRTYRGNGNGKGYETGFVYDGALSAAELKPLAAPIADKGHGGLEPGDTIEVHWVFSTAEVAPGPTLGACLKEGAATPRLRVEAQVFVLVNDPAALDFTALAAVSTRGGLHQALAIPSDTGTPVAYAGSTTGPGYNEAGSPFQVSWSVRPKVAKLDITSVGEWLKGNPFDEDHAHGVRNLVVQPELLSTIGE
ncbi:delta-class carbonic anhydrase [Vannielia sp. SX4]|uniref:delta-class carbonic anhydrase n=1 Tax=Vannielia sp. SX4 TaxID=3463852 RepID=UPI00405946E5